MFSRTADYEHFLQLMREATEDHTTAIHAYVLMTNHIHLMATPATETSIPGFMKQVGEQYSLYFNTTYVRTGTPWDGRYKALLLTDERYWLTCLRYIEQNPVRAGMVLRAEDYSWSSYGMHAFGKSQEGLHSHALFDALGRSPAERSEAYRHLSATPLNEDEVRRLRKPSGAPSSLVLRRGQTPGSDPSPR